MKHIIVCLVCQCIYLYPPLCTHLTNMLSRVYYDSMYTLPQYTKSKVNRLIPSPVRKALGAKPGDDLLWEISPDAVRLKLAPKDWMSYLRGSGTGVYGNSDEYIKSLRNEWSKS